MRPSNLRKKGRYERLLSGFVVLSVAFFSLAFAVIHAYAQTGPPQIISYQGRLTDSSGNLLGGSGTTYYFRFSIYDASSGGTKLWPSGTPCSHARTVRNGVFTANIGDTSSCADVLNFNFQDNQDTYLQVEVSSDNSTWETLTPRQRITSAGYALNASTTQGALPGTGPNNLLKLDASGNIDIAGDILTSGNATSSILYATTIGTNNEYFTDLTGTGLTNSSGVLTLDATGDWTGTLDGFEGADFFALSAWYATTTDALAEGSTNKYYATSLFASDLAGTTTDALAQGSNNKYYATSLFAGDLAGTTTDALAEGSNRLYYTNARVESVINSSSTIPNLGGSAYGDLISWSGSAWERRATSTLSVALSDTSGTLSVSRGGTGVTTFGGTNTILYTSSADTLASNSNFVFNGTNMGVGSSTPWARLAVQAADNSSDNQFVVASSTANSLVVDSSGNVGVGTASPGSALTVASGRLQVSGSTVPSSGAGVEISYDGTDGIIVPYDRDAGAYKNLRFNGLSYEWETSLTDRMVLTAGGFLGIGTTTPWGRLSVQAADNASDPQFVVASSTQTNFFVGSNSRVGVNTADPQSTVDIRVTPGTTLPAISAATGLVVGRTDVSLGGASLSLIGSGLSTNFINFGDTGDENPGWIAYGNNCCGGTDYMTFGVATAERMRITAEGNVGIGTTTPSAPLEILNPGSGRTALIDGGNGVGGATTLPTISSNTDVIISGYSLNPTTQLSLIGDSNSVLNFGDTSDEDVGQILYQHTSGLDSMIFKTNATEALRIDSSQRVGISTTTPWGHLSIEGQGSNPAFVVSDTSNNTDFIVDADGEVGIGMSNPSESLHINSGNIKFQTYGSLIKYNGILSADVSAIKFGVTEDGVLRNGLVLGNGVDDLYINQDGDIGVASSSAWAKLSVAVEDNRSAPQFVVASSTAMSLIVDASGNVGVGTASPEAKMQITGGGLCVGSDANCNSDNNTEGTVYSGSTSMTVYDVAEMYPTTDTSIKPAEVVALDPDNGVFVKRAVGNDDEVLLGVISTEPAVLLGGFAGTQFQNEHQVAVALSGRVPVRVNLEGGDINIGDALTISSEPGVAKKAEDGEQEIGLALEDYDGTQATSSIQSFVRLGSARIAKGVDIAALSATTTEYYANSSFVSAVGEALASLGVKIANGVVKVKDLVVSSLTAGDITVKNEDVTKTGITIYDRATGEPTCVFVENSVMKTAQGECGSDVIKDDSLKLNYPGKDPGKSVSPTIVDAGSDAATSTTSATTTSGGADSGSSQNATSTSTEEKTATRTSSATSTQPATQTATTQTTTSTSTDSNTDMQDETATTTNSGTETQTDATTQADRGGSLQTDDTATTTATSTGAQTTSTSSRQDASGQTTSTSSPQGASGQAGQASTTETSV